MVKKYLNIIFLVKALLIICLFHNNYANGMEKHFLKLRKYAPITSTLIRRDCGSSFKLPKYSCTFSNSPTNKEDYQNIYQPTDEDKHNLSYDAKNIYRLSNKLMARFNRIALNESIEGNTEISDALIEIDSFSNPSLNKLGRALIRASEEGHKELIEFLIKAGANINYKGVNGVTAFMMAVYHRRTEIFEALLGFGADINAQNDNGRSVLMVSRYHNNKAITRWLIQRGANVNAKDLYGQTDLMKAAADNCEDSIKFAKILIKANADVNAKDEEGNTALIIAGLYENVEMVRLLLKAGASINIRNKENETILMMLVNELDDYQQEFSKNHYLIIKMILDHALNSER